MLYDYRMADQQQAVLLIIECRAEYSYCYLNFWNNLIMDYTFILLDTNIY